ncbi:MAG TPA: hypothetical protein VKP58_02405 [Candidatus Acidoferrum sp.]|nr:hypothetical protein [Candidatus Acidoferrum sp.]
MDAFEQVVSEILLFEGYWVRTSVKVELTPRDKRAIGRPNAPRWELDIVAYNVRDNLLRVVECKGYLYSRGVTFASLDGTSEGSAKRFKLFVDSHLRKVVFGRLCKQFTKSGACRPKPRVKLCLACGHIATDHDREKLKNHFTKRGWELLDERWLKGKLYEMAENCYENKVPIVVTKLVEDQEVGNFCGKKKMTLSSRS